MTYDEITLFRRFLSGKGVTNNFEWFYVNHRFHPVSIEDYYEHVMAEDVILDAFDMSSAGNTIFNFKYWKALDEKWQRKLLEFRVTGVIDDEKATVKCAQCGRTLPRTAFAYRSNGTLHKHCRECESGEYARRLKEFKKAQSEASNLQLLTETAECHRKKQISAALEYAAKVDERLEKEANKPEIDNTNQTEKKMEDFTFFDFESKKVQSHTIGPNKFAVNNKKGNYSVVINADDSKTIINGNLLRLRLRQDNITGALHFVFNATTGAACVVRNDKNVTVVNKDLVVFLLDLLGYPKSTERVLVEISENLSRTKDFVTFLIKRPRK